MIGQLLIGAGIVSLTVAIVAVSVGVAIKVLTRVGPWLTKPPRPFKMIVSVIGVTLWLLAALTAAVWIWAALFMSIGLFAALEPALYFAITAFTTLGFGDITIPAPWRILSGICAANGLLLFGLSTAFLVEFFNRLHRAHNGAS